MNEESTAKKGIRGLPAALRGGLGRIFGPMARWVRRHKKSFAALIVLAAAGSFLGWRFLAAGRGAAGGGAPAFVRAAVPSHADNLWPHCGVPPCKMRHSGAVG